MQFDIRTLLVAVAVASAFCALARLLLWRMHPTLPGLGSWAAASGFGVASLMLLAFNSSMGTFPALALVQLCVVAGFGLSLNGFRLFVGRPPLSLWAVLLLLVLTLMAIGFAHIDPTLRSHSIGNALIITVLSALIARQLLASTGAKQVAMRATGLVYGINALFFLLRAIEVASGSGDVAPLDPDGLSAVSILWWLCMVVGTTLGMVLMTSERLQSELDHQASRDPLTGALNRRAFTLIADKEVARARRHGQPLSMLMMDLDHFKQINDRLGHGAGDAILRRFVATANQVLRSEDTFCRFGGEEFVALLPETPVEKALVAADRLRHIFADETASAVEALGGPLPFSITVSVGLGELEKGEAIDGLLQRTDVALYRAKGMGRNRSVVANP